jgi:hypothetical protein
MLVQSASQRQLAFLLGGYQVYNKTIFFNSEAMMVVFGSFCAPELIIKWMFFDFTPLSNIPEMYFFNRI